MNFIIPVCWYHGGWRLILREWVTRYTGGVTEGRTRGRTLEVTGGIETRSLILKTETRDQDEKLFVYT